MEVNEIFNEASVGGMEIDSVGTSKRPDPDQPQRDRYVSDTKMRKHMAYWVCGISTVWLALMMWVIVKQLPMTQECFIAVLCTATANVLGLPYIVLHGLFDKQ